MSTDFVPARVWVACTVIGAAACALSFTAPVTADVVYGIEGGVGYSDNIRRTSSAEESETIGVAGFDLAWRETTRRIDADVGVDLSYLEYLDDTFDSELVGTADGTIVVGLAPERFTWLFEDSFGQAQSDPFAPATPETRENVNFFTTGPDLLVRLGSAGSLRLFGRYSVTDYEDSPLDAERVGGGFALSRSPSSRSDLALNAITEEIDFEDGDDSDYDRESAFFSYDLRGARTDIEAQLGYTWIERNDGRKSDGPLARLSVSREVSAASTVYLALGTGITGAEDSLRASLGGAQGGGGQAAITATDSPFEERTAELGWSFSRNRTTFGLSGAWREERYEDVSDLDRTSIVYSANVSREVSRTLTGGLLASLVDEEFDTTGLTSDELRFGAFLRWRPGRLFEYAITVDRYDRETSNDVGEYVENRTLLTVTYRPRGESSGGRRRR